MNNYKRKWNFKSILTILVVSGTIGTLNAQQDRRTEYPDFSYGEGVENNEWIQAIKVIEPACRSHVKGKVNISFQAKGMKT